MKPIAAIFCSLTMLALVTAQVTVGQDKTEVKTDVATETVVQKTAPQIQMAILLDTSGSMDGLINQARAQIWKIVNELATAKQNGQIPDLQVALYEYGKNSIPKEQGYLRQIVPLSDDLDKLSQELFALRTNGGKEYCGQVIAAATNELKWSKSDSALKLIFIAGNEPFSQGQVSYKDACSNAIKKGITINTIHCGPESIGIRTGWQEGAQLADGSFMSINQNRQVAAIATPYDKKLATLSSEINKTFLFTGNESLRKSKKSLQLAADKSAAGAARGSAAERATFKGTTLYKTSGDLILGLKNGKLKLKDLKDDQLPKALQGKTLKEKEAYCAKLTKERSRIQSEIGKLSAQRVKFIDEARKKQTKSDGASALDVAVIKAIREQAARKQFKFDKKK